MDEVVLTFTTTTDTLALNHHYLGIVEAQNDMGGRNSSDIPFSKYTTANNLQVIPISLVVLIPTSYFDYEYNYFAIQGKIPNN